MSENSWTTEIFVPNSLEQVIFDITGAPDGTRLRFTHQGLRPTVECYQACSRGWDFYINQSLKNLILVGTGEPIPKP